MGKKHSVMQIHAPLYVVSEPMDAAGILETLRLVRSNVLTGLKELQGWKLVKAGRGLGEGRKA